MTDEFAPYDSQLVPLDSSEDFGSASDYAKELARAFNVQTGIQRDGPRWAVLVPRWVATAIESTDQDDVEDEVPEHVSQADYSSDQENDDYYEEVLEEMESDQEAWARSDEDGWYYED